MHRCLEVDDIFHHVITILSISREPMNALWRKLEGLAPLLECMPSDLISERYVAAIWSEPYLDVQAYFTRRPTSSEWAQMFKHAHRVRELTLGMGQPPAARYRSASSYSASVLSSVVQYMRSSARKDLFVELFPNLLVLRCRWYQRLQGIVDCIPGLAGPLLRTVKVYGDTSRADDTEPLDRLLAKILTTHPKVQELTVVADCAPLNQPQRLPCATVLSDFLNTAPQLRTFQTNIPITRTSISNLAGMPYLSLLTVHLPDDLSELGTQASLGSLKAVDITARSLATCTQFIASLWSDSLRSLDIQIRESCEADAVVSCFRAIGAHTTLRRIRMFADRSHFTPTTACSVYGSAIAPLLSLSRLEDLVIEEHIRVDLQDRDVVALSKAWPRLRNLTLDGLSQVLRSSSKANVSLGALLQLSRNCKRLRRLGLAFDASTVDAGLFDEGTKAGTACDQLYMLEIQAPLSRVTQPEKVACLLHVVFPNLRILSFGTSDAETDGGWQRVCRIMKTLAYRTAIV